VVTRLRAAGRDCVVVPLLLSAGYHVRVDIAAAVAGGSAGGSGDSSAGGEGAAGGAVAARALGPDPLLVDVLSDRLAEAGARPDAAVLLAAAGSSDPGATAQVEDMAAALGRRLERRVTACYLSAARPRVDAAVAAAAADHPEVTVVTYLLGPGRLADAIAERAARAGAGVITRPLAGHPALARLALARYDEAAAAPAAG